MRAISHQQWLATASDLFQNISDTADLDARVLLCHCLNKPLSYLLAWPERFIDEDNLSQLGAVRQRRLKGEPISYIVGYQEFWSLDFKVNASVLIPRPETELMVEWALSKTNAADKSMKIIDLGTGSGAIAIALATELPNSQIIATDISAQALAVAKENAHLNHCTNIKFIESSWLDQIVEDAFDLVLANPPYVAENDPHLLLGDLPFEPRGALIAANNGFADIEKIALDSAKHLKPSGWIAIEHGYQQATEVAAIFNRYNLKNIETIKDLAKLDRITVAQAGGGE